jgi:hypothetical protein
MAAVLLLFCFLFATTYAWVATEYWQLSVETTSGFYGGTQTTTITIPVIPTAAVTPISTDTNDQYDSDVTMIDLFLSGSNLPVTTPYGEFNPCPSINPSCLFTTTSSGTGIPTETTYFALATVTQPSSCTATKFSYRNQNPPHFYFQETKPSRILHRSQSPQRSNNRPLHHINICASHHIQ